MIEIFQIFLQILVIFIFCYFPQYYLNFFDLKQQSIIEKISLGVIINIFILLLLSFSNQKNFNLVYIVLIIIFCNNLFFFTIENWGFKLFDTKFIFLFISLGKIAKLEKEIRKLNNIVNHLLKRKNDE